MSFVAVRHGSRLLEFLRTQHVGAGPQLRPSERSRSVTAVGAQRSADTPSQQWPGTPISGPLFATTCDPTCQTWARSAGAASVGGPGRSPAARGGIPLTVGERAGGDHGIGQPLARSLARAVLVAGISEEMIRFSKSAPPVYPRGRVSWRRPVAKGRPASPSRVAGPRPRTTFVPFAEAGASQAGQLLVNPMLGWLEE